MKQSSGSEIISQLGLEPHDEGGYYKIIYSSTPDLKVETSSGERQVANSIHYMLTKEKPIGYWHKNKSDILTYHHMGNSLLYRFIYADGGYEEVVLGTNVQKGEKIFFVAKGDSWKCTELLKGESDFGLLSEVVVPGFDWSDHEYAKKEKMLAQYPHIDQSLFDRFCKPDL